MRLMVLFCIYFILIGGIIFAEDGDVDFAGEWILNMDKSEIPEGRGGRRGRAVTKMVITQDENKLVVESTRTNRDGEEMIIEAIYTLDGEESENELYNTTSKSTAEWSEDGKSLKINTEATFSRNGEEFTMKAKNTWSLEDGNLIIDSIRSTPWGERESKLLYINADVIEE